MDFFKKVIVSVSSGGLAPDFPYILDELIANETEVSITSGVWSIHKAHNIAFKKEDHSGQATVFIADLIKNPNVAAGARNSLKRLKIIRHPRVLKLLDGVEVDGKVLIATEPVTPFVPRQAQLAKSVDHILWGLYCITEALKFINEDAKMIHGNIRKSSLFITKAGEIKLSGFELTASINDSNSLLTETEKVFRGCNIQAWPPEMRRSSWQAIRSNPIHAIDSWMLGNLIEEIFGNENSTLNAFCQSALSQDPSKRHSSSGLLEPLTFQRCFNVPIVAADRLVCRLAGVDVAERDKLYITLQNYLPKLPSEFISFKAVATTISLLENQQLSLEALKLVLLAIKFVDDKLFEACFEPTVIMLFSRPDRAVRLLLIDYLEDMIDKLSQKAIQDSIFGHFVGGFSDLMPELRERTLKSSITLVPKLTTRQINNDLVRNYIRLQTDEQPGIRVNAIICLGKIASSLDETSKQKIFLTSISRSLQDPFPPSRSAALAALLTTIDSFSSDNLAQKLLPLICHLLVDRDQSVKEQAFASARKILDRLESRTESLIQGATGETNLDSVKSPTSDWRSWGIGTITSQMSKIQKKYSGTSAEPSPEPSVDTHSCRSPPLASKSKAMSLSRGKERRNDQSQDEDIVVAENEKTQYANERDLSSEDPQEETSPVLLKNLNLKDGWGDQDDFDPWSAN